MEQLSFIPHPVLVLCFGSSCEEQTVKRVFVVDDEKSMCEVLRLLLEDDGYSVISAHHGREAIERIADGEEVDLIISDLKMPELDGMDILNFLRDTEREIPLIMITAYGTIEDAVEAMKKGASDFITKPFNKDMIRHVVRRIFRMEHLEKENRVLKASQGIPRMVYRSRKMREIMEIVKKVAHVPTPVLITGESGTGKQLIAKTVHAFDEKKPFVEIDCPAIPDTLLESELFGYRKGAFTGADSNYEGKARIADGGILFLDEIADLPMSMQSKLLKVLEDKTFFPLGSNKPIKIDTRVLCATNRDLRQMVREGSFRQDLFYRINTITIHLPPLRERKDDIVILAQHFIERFCQELRREQKMISEPVRRALRAYDWPGNVRELRNVIERVIVLSARPMIELEDLPCEFWTDPDNTWERSLSKLASSEKRLLEEALQKWQGNVSAAARELGISRGTMRYRVQKYSID
jgi:DNA-binding NtrC family response regulator